MMKTPLSYLEYQQLELIVPAKLDRSSKPSLSSKLKCIWQFFGTTITRESEPRVYYTCDSVGNIWWSAFDPVTGRSLNCVSEAEMRTWLEQRHH